MDSGMVAKIEKAMRYAQEPDRMTFHRFEVTFNGDNSSHTITYNEGKWTCTCNFFENRGICSHTMTLERVLRGMVETAEAIPVPQ